MILSTWTIVSFPCVCLRWLQQLIAHGHVPADVLVMVDTAWGSLKTGITLRQLSPRVRASGGVCSLPHGKLSLADSVATKQPLLFKRSQWLNKLRRYDNHTYTHTHEPLVMIIDHHQPRTQHTRVYTFSNAHLHVTCQSTHAVRIRSDVRISWTSTYTTPRKK